MADKRAGCQSPRPFSVLEFIIWIHFLKLCNNSPGVDSLTRQRVDSFYNGGRGKQLSDCALFVLALPKRRRKQSNSYSIEVLRG